jgi:hypothetical protein
MDAKTSCNTAQNRIISPAQRTMRVAHRKDGPNAVSGCYHQWLRATTSAERRADSSRIQMSILREQDRLQRFRGFRGDGSRASESSALGCQKRWATDSLEQSDRFLANSQHDQLALRPTSSAGLIIGSTGLRAGARIMNIACLGWLFLSWGR